MNVTIVGAGHVGLVTGVCLAVKGHAVYCIDIDARLVHRLSEGKPHIFEPGLGVLLSTVLEQGRFRVTMDLEEALDRCELVLLAVGTPSDRGVIDLSHVLKVCGRIGRYMRRRGRFLAVVVKSTVIPGTTDTMVRREMERASGLSFPHFGLGMNPEFLREGEAISDFMEPDRIVLGFEDGRTLELLEALYAPWEVEKLRVNTRSAELIKYANNALLATQISAFNEIANLADALGNIDVADVVRGVHLDRRFNPILDDKRVWPGFLAYLVPGCGFGGSCLPKDVQAMRSQGVEMGLPMQLMNAVLQINEEQPFKVAEILEREVGSLATQTILVLGLAFKAGTDDVRESASLKIVRSLLEKGATVLVHDPVANENFRCAMGAKADLIVFVEDWVAQVEAADVIIVATRWADYLRLAQLDLIGKTLFDARRMFDPATINAGRYLSVGRRVEAFRSNDVEGEP